MAQLFPESVAADEALKWLYSKQIASSPRLSEKQ
jgi:hypothetical protein